MDLHLIYTGTAEHEAMVALRVRALLEPIGISADYVQHDKEDDLFVGAFDNGALTGCCVLTPRGEGLIQLRQMVVEPALQGKKIGAAILVFAEQVARQHGFSRLMMHARDTVIPFYEKSGYTSTGPQFFEVGIGHHRMEKDL